MDIERLKGKFNEHYHKYDISDASIKRKYFHSLRVMELARNIAISNNFDEKSLELVTIASLLHDYARFEQWTLYKTFSDFKSIDHGDLGVKMLFDNNEIKDYSLNSEDYDKIYDCIKYHNKFCIPDNLSSYNKLLCKVIRDADKLDIFYLFGVDKETMKEDDKDISLLVREEFFKEKGILNKDAVSGNDRIILKLSMIFDLNFDYSFNYINDNNLILKMYDNIVDKERFKEYFDYILEYIKKRCK